jgi:hypothetical protein
VSAAAHPTPRQGILWIASYPKSGNTWTRVFLHNLFNMLEGRSAEHDINKLNEYTSWDLAAKAYEEILDKPVSQATHAEIAAARLRVQENVAIRTNGLTLTKTHHALVEDCGVPTINFSVTSGAVYLVRNPLDIAVSFAAHLNTDLDAAIDQMCTEGLETIMNDERVYEVYGSWSQHVESWTRNPNRALYVMRYEDMLDAPLKSFSKLAAHLLLRPTAQQLSDAIANSSFEKLASQEKRAGFAEKPDPAERFFRAGKSGEWRKALTRRQIRKIVSRHHVQMRRFGYLSDDVRHLAES